MLNVIRQYIPRAGTLFSYETTTSKVLLHLILFSPICGRYLDGSLRRNEALFSVFLLALDILLAVLSHRLQRARNAPRRLNNGPSVEFIVAGLYIAFSMLSPTIVSSSSIRGRLPTHFAPRLSTWLASPPGFLTKDFRILPRLLLLVRRLNKWLLRGVTTGLSIALDYLYRKPLGACLKVLDKVVSLDPRNALISIVGLGFFIGSFGVLARLLKIVSDRRRLLRTQDEAPRNPNTVVHRLGRWLPKPEPNNGHPGEPVRNTSEIRSESQFRANVDQNPANKESKKTPISGASGGYSSRSVDAKSAAGSLAVKPKKFSVFTTGDRQSYRHLYALAARRAATKAYNTFQRNQRQQAPPENVSRIQPEVPRSDSSNAKAIPERGSSTLDQKESRKDRPSAASVSEVSAKKFEQDENPEGRKAYRDRNEVNDTQHSVVEEEAAIKSIWRNDAHRRTEHDMDLDESGRMHPARRLETAVVVVPANTQPAAENVNANIGIDRREVIRANGHGRSSGPSDLHDENNSATPISNNQIERVDFLNLEPSPAPPGPGPKPEKPEDALSSLVLPPHGIRHELEVRLQRTDLPDPVGSNDNNDDKRNHDDGGEDEELGAAYCLRPPRFALSLPLGQPRGERLQDGIAEVDDDVWFASRTLHREIAHEEPDLADISFGS